MQKKGTLYQLGRCNWSCIFAKYITTGRPSVILKPFLCTDRDWTIPLCCQCLIFGKKAIFSFISFFYHEFCKILNISLSSFIMFSQLFSGQHGFISRMVSAGENICDTYSKDFALMASFFISIKSQSLDFAIMGGTLVCLLPFA